ncbi:MAG: diaminopropionate ammonia-lyase [Thermanaerothrix sp.]|nr:diaminopropionate ammonia-lyase [Thermanaerothrix sp.]
MEEIRYVVNGPERGMRGSAPVDRFSPEEMNKVVGFHSTMPGYEPTPLASLPSLAKRLGLGAVHVKDESHRFGLKAFKVLGGCYAIAMHLAKLLGKDISDLPFEVLTSDEVKSKLGDITFATTTDGNHGRGVAWTARMLRQKAVVYMPKGSAQFRLEKIRGEGAEAEILDMNYDDAVRYTDQQARKHGWVVVQDTAWEGYTDIPLWIMQGYGTMVVEALDQLKAKGEDMPTHVFIQAGVGSLAGAVQGVLRARFGQSAPKVVVVEASAAACYYESAVAGDGKPRAVGGDLFTLMAGLACGEVNIIGYEILRDYAAAFVSCPDYVAARGMRVLGNPLEGDQRVVSGESGAVTAGLLAYLMGKEELKGLKDALGLDSSSRVLLFSTEGDTDPDRYRSVVWDGEFPTFGHLPRP